MSAVFDFTKKTVVSYIRNLAELVNRFPRLVVQWSTVKKCKFLALGKREHRTCVGEFEQFLERAGRDSL